MKHMSMENEPWSPKRLPVIEDGPMDVHEYYDDVSMYLINEKKCRLSNVGISNHGPETVLELIAAAEDLLGVIRDGGLPMNAVRVAGSERRLFDANGRCDESCLAEWFATIKRCQEAIGNADHESDVGLKEIADSAQLLLALSERLRLVFVLQEKLYDWDKICFNDLESVGNAMDALLLALDPVIGQGDGSQPESITREGGVLSELVQDRMQDMVDILEDGQPGYLERISGIAREIRTMVSTMD